MEEPVQKSSSPTIHGPSSGKTKIKERLRTSRRAKTVNEVIRATLPRLTVNKLMVFVYIVKPKLLRRRTTRVVGRTNVPPSVSRAPTVSCQSKDVTVADGVHGGPVVRPPVTLFVCSTSCPLPLLPYSEYRLRKGIQRKSKEGKVREAAPKTWGTTEKGLQSRQITPLRPRRKPLKGRNRGRTHKKRAKDPSYTCVREERDRKLGLCTEHP